MSVPYILTRDNLTVFLGTVPREIGGESPEFSKVLDVIKSGAVDAADQISKILDAALNRVKQAIVAAPTSGVSLTNGQVYFNGQPLHNTLTERMLSMVELGIDITPLTTFLDNLMKNPSYRVVQKLYDFLEAGGLPITADGHFLAYKKVRSDWKDIHSGTLDNSVGNVLEIPRNQVDEDAERTCSYGLHVCSFGYLGSFGDAYDSRIVIVKVNPADVVAIPSDYNDTKMRVCRYEVVDEHKTSGVRDTTDSLRGTLVVDKYDGVEDEEIVAILQDAEDHGAIVTKNDQGFLVSFDKVYTNDGTGVVEDRWDGNDDSSDDYYW